VGDRLESTRNGVAPVADWTWIDSWSALLFVIWAILPPLAVSMLISGLDDLFIDIQFFRLWRARRRLFKRHGGKTARDLPAASLPLAIFIPAWDESAIIEQMLSRACAAWSNEPDLRLFVGWYSNDLATGRAVARAALADPRVLPVVVPHAGPTTKADCLNHLWVAMLEHERRHASAFAAVLLHDAEDEVSPAEPATARYLVGQRGKQLVQFPVQPVPVQGAPLVSGHYLDEFAESHAKDLPVREWMGAPLPAAGVGCAFARQALATVATSRGGLPFDGRSLTEDYDLGLRLSRAGAGAFVRIAMAPRGRLVATREHFPCRFDSAVRQKARWLTGITLDGWDGFGWRGSLVDRYWLMRDRKPILTFYLNLCCYFVVLVFVAQALWQHLDPAAPGFAPLVTQHWVTIVLAINGSLLAWRLFVRALFVWRLAGWREALLSLPRALVGNAINMGAAIRAIGLFLHRRTGGPPRWDKTRHDSLPGDPA
jgi:bacteriophage N4 adsorption protein B